MKNNSNKTVLLIASLLIISSSFAQTKYYSRFDNNTEKAGWMEFNKGKKTFKNWEYQSNGAGSSAFKLNNTVPTGDANKDSLVDWFVSPKFNFSNGGKIDSIKYNYFSYMNVFIKEQFVGIYLLVGSNDPAKATSKVLLANLTKNYSGDDKWSDTGDFIIPSTSGDCYIAFKFKAVDGWSSISYDNVNITSNKTSALIQANKTPTLSIYPNPIKNQINFKIEDNNSNSQKSRLKIFSMSGQLLIEKEINLTEPFLVNLKNGIYIYELYTETKKRTSSKLIVQK